MRSARITSAPIAIPAKAPADKGARWPFVASIIMVDVEVTNVDCPALVICCVRVTICPDLVVIKTVCVFNV